jgi:glycosyltransferase involved in cell wall biosynthesis
MNIAYLSSAVIPSTSANSVQVMKMCQAIEEEGHAVTLYLPPAAKDISPEETARRYGVRVEFPMRRVRLSGLLGRRGLAWAEVADAAGRAPDLIYTRGFDFAWLASLRGLPVILEIHHSPTGRLGPFYLRRVLGRPRVNLVVISRRLEEILRAGYPALKGRAMLVAPDAVDWEPYRDLPTPEAARERLGLPAGRPAAGYVGGLVAGRGLELIIELAKRIPRMDFLILGGSLREVDRWKAQTAGVGNLRWLGFVPNAEVPLYQAACDVLLMPYQREVTIQGKGNTADIMSPMKLYEYLAAGRVIMASDLPALRVALNETNSLLLPCDDAAAWARALEEILRDPARGGRKAARAREDVRSNTWRNRVKTILDFSAGEHG